MNELLEKIKKIEALIQGAQTQGERNAALLAKQRVNKKIESSKDVQEFTMYTSDSWHKKLLLAICRKHGLAPYRYRRQKYTTVMVRAEEEFLNNVIWKEYLEYSEHLEVLVEEITNNLIQKIYKHEDEDLIQGRLK